MSPGVCTRWFALALSGRAETPRGPPSCDLADPRAGADLERGAAGEGGDGEERTETETGQVGVGEGAEERTGMWPSNSGRAHVMCALSV